MKLALIRDVLDVVLDEGTAARDRPMRGAVDPVRAREGGAGPGAGGEPGGGIGNWDGRGGRELLGLTVGAAALAAFLGLASSGVDGVYLDEVLDSDAMHAGRFGLGDACGAALWTVSLYYLSPYQAVLLFLGRLETARPSDWVLRQVGRALHGSDLDDPDFEASRSVYAATWAIFAASGASVALALNVLLGEATWSVSSGIGLGLAAGVYELGRPKRYNLDEKAELDAQWRDFQSFAEARLELAGRCHISEIGRAFRRSNPRYRTPEQLSDKTLRSLVANWAPQAQRSSQGYYRGLSVRKVPLEPPRSGSPGEAGGEAGEGAGAAAVPEVALGGWEGDAGCPPADWRDAS